MEKTGTVSMNKLFDRAPDPSYLEEWSKLLAESSEQFEEVKEFPVVAFRLYNEWFGLSALIFSEIASQRTINEIPYHNNPILLGIVNLRGQLRLCFSMHLLLGMTNDLELASNGSKTQYPRLLAITEQNEVWTFPVEEVEGILQIDLTKMSNIPVNVLNSKENFLKGVVNWDDKKIYVINEELLFMTLRRKLV